MDKRLKRILAFSDILHRYQTVERILPIPYVNRLETDVEHSYVLTMLAWYIMETEKLPLDHGKVLKYALAHDLIEVYAGDTATVGKQENKKSVATKKRREKAAQEKLKRIVPEFKELHAFIEGYEHRKDPEARFVYALDKIAPQFVTTLYKDKGRALYKKRRITLQILDDYKKEKVKNHPVAEALWKSLHTFLGSYHKKHGLFPTIAPAKKSSRQK